MSAKVVRWSVRGQSDTAPNQFVPTAHLPLQASGHFMQSPAWANLKQHHGWSSRWLEFPANGKLYRFLIYSRRVPLIGKVHYVPRPLAPTQLGEVRRLAQWLKQTHRGIALLFEPELLDSPTSHQAFLRAGFQPTKSIQPPSTVEVNTEGTEADIFAGFKKKTRNELRKAAKSGVKVLEVPITPESMQTLYGLIKATQSRKKHFVRPKAYCFETWRGFAALGQAKMFFAQHDQDLLAAAFVIIGGDRAWYKDGGSLRLKSNLYAPTLLQWEIIRQLKNSGVKRYDLMGVTPKVAREQGLAHPLQTLSAFKLQFCSQPTDYLGNYVLPLSRWRFMVWRRVGGLYQQAYYHLTRNYWY